jgi:hypothetical protein
LPTTPRGASAVVEQLEARIQSLLPERDKVALAYSGGLSSTLLAMLVRKRCDLHCFVAGVEGSPDVLAAKAARDHLDYRVEIVDLDAATRRRIMRDLRASRPSLSSTSVHALVPLAAVREKTLGRVLLTGFGARRLDARFASVLRTWRARSPLSEISPGGIPRRAVLQIAALSLGLPIEWARIAHRAPAEGAGIERFLQTVGPSGGHSGSSAKFD